MKTVKKIEVTRPVLPTRKRVAAYARVSMESDRMMHSLSTQVSYYNELIQSNPEWEFAGVYADNFISGTSTDKRTEFQRMMADCEAGRIDIVLTKSISRLTSLGRVFASGATKCTRSIIPWRDTTRIGPSLSSLKRPTAILESPE